MSRSQLQSKVPKRAIMLDPNGEERLGANQICQQKTRIVEDSKRRNLAEVGAKLRRHELIFEETCKMHVNFIPIGNRKRVLGCRSGHVEPRKEITFEQSRHIVII